MDPVDTNWVRLSLWQPLRSRPVASGHLEPAATSVLDIRYLPAIHSAQWFVFLKLSPISARQIDTTSAPESSTAPVSLGMIAMNAEEIRSVATWMAGWATISLHFARAVCMTAFASGSL